MRIWGLFWSQRKTFAAQAECFCGDVQKWWVRVFLEAPTSIVYSSCWFLGVFSYGILLFPLQTEGKTPPFEASHRKPPRPFAALLKAVSQLARCLCGGCRSVERHCGLASEGGCERGLAQTGQWVGLLVRCLVVKSFSTGFNILLSCCLLSIFLGWIQFTHIVWTGFKPTRWFRLDWILWKEEM